MPQRSPLRTLAVVLAAIGLLFGWNLPFAQGAPKCFGKPASILGTSKSDFIRGTSRDDVIVGLDGNDHILGDAGNDRICGGDGHDQQMYGGPGRDRIAGGALIDDISGGKGNDILRGSSGGDLLYGDRGVDVLLGGAGFDQLEGGDADDLLMGGAGDDDLGGYNVDEGDDLARGGPGDDLLMHWVGSDRLDGGPGTDYVGSGSDGATIDLSAGTASGNGVATLAAIEGARGTFGNDVLVGNSGDNFFAPLYGDDRIDGREGRDQVSFERLDNYFKGITVDLADGTSSGAVGSKTVVGIEDVVGSDGSDTIRGSDEANRLSGGPGNDVLEGRAGDDLLDGDSFGEQSQSLDDDAADGGPHIAGDVCVDVARPTNCEFSGPPTRLVARRFHLV
jgi:Ca2+-binding RTX toxin-like protein